MTVQRKTLLASGGIALVLLAATIYFARHRLEEEWLLRALRSGDPSEVAGAAERLGHLRSARAAPDLVRLFAETPGHWRFGLNGAATFFEPSVFGKALVEIGKPAVKPLLDLAKREPQARRFVGEVVAAIGPAAVKDLVRALEDEDLRVTASYALGDIGRPAVTGVLDRLERLLGDDLEIGSADHALASALIDTLAKAGKAGEGPLARLLASETSAVVGLAAAALRRAGAAGLLADSIRDPDLRSGTRRLAAETLARVGETALPQIEVLVADEAPQVRIYALFAASCMVRSHQAPLAKEDPISPALELLERGFEDPDAQVRSYTVNLLGHHGRLPERMLEGMRRLLEDEETAVRESAAELLRNLEARRR